MSSATEESTPVRGVRWRRLVLLNAVLPLLGLGLFAAYLSFVDYVKWDPGFCGTCHQARQEYTLWARSEHRGIVCQNCHHNRDGESLRVLFQFLGAGTAQQEGKGHGADVSINACQSCHLQHDPRWPQVGGSVGHQLHLQAEGVSCLDCHARSIHKFAPATDACRQCHGAQSLHTDGMESLHCLACHNFLSTDGSMRPTVGSCLECHRSRGMSDKSFPKDAPMAALACGDCHRPHADDQHDMVPCDDCHERTPTFGLHGAHVERPCGDCHDPHSWVATRDDCLACHTRVAHRQEVSQGPCHACHLFEGPAGGEQ